MPELSASLSRCRRKITSVSFNRCECGPDSGSVNEWIEFNERPGEGTVAYHLTKSVLLEVVLLSLYFLRTPLS